MIKDLLVGNTGFVGGNLANSHDFEAVCHSTDIGEFYGSRPDLCVYAGVPSAMFLANHSPAADMEVMRQARENIRCIRPRQLVLLSTIAVYADSRGKTEKDAALVKELPPYGFNRLSLENWIREDFPEALIIRLPALYGNGLKKNFLFDLHTITPSMLSPDVYETLAAKSDLVFQGYSLSDNGFFKLNEKVDAGALREFFSRNDFNALSFTDSRSRYQFYSLKRLWNDIKLALSFSLQLLNLTTPPISAQKVYSAVTGKDNWQNELEGTPFDYDLRSQYAHILNGSLGYLCSEDEEIADIKKFMDGWGKA